VNYLGLYNEEIADVWLGFFSHDHYDGTREWKDTDWGTPLVDYRQAAKERLQRLKGRNCLISQDSEADEISFETKNYLEENNLDTLARITYNLFSVPSIIPEIPSKDIPHRHTDKWLLYESKNRNMVYDWFLQTIKSKPNTYSISGVVQDSKGDPVTGVYVESGRTHYAITNNKGAYSLEGLTSGFRKITILDKENNYILFSQSVSLESNIDGLDYSILD
jgi:hypothetical protein